MDSFELNRRNWDERADLHATAPEYGLHRFRSEPDFISDVVRFDLPLLGDIAGMRGVHLQCHIGTDTISLERLGAAMTGLDFSESSLAVARSLAQDVGSGTDFVLAEVYDASEILPPGSFDFVYTGIGALCWLPDIRRWASTVHSLLRPGGRLFVREGHPMLWAVDDRIEDRLVLEYPYFETEEPLEESEEQTYVTADRGLVNATTHSWNHGLGEIVSALIDSGMTINGMVEHTSVPWEALPGQMVRQDAEWVLAARAERLPLTYTLQAVKSGIPDPS